MLLEAVAVFVAIVVAWFMVLWTENEALITVVVLALLLGPFLLCEVALAVDLYQRWDEHPLHYARLWAFFHLPIVTWLLGRAKDFMTLRAGG